MSEQLALLPGYLAAHLQLTLVALLLGTAASLPLGIWVTRHPRAEALVLGIAGMIQTIPSLALLAVMVPMLTVAGAASVRAFGVAIPSIGYLPAIIGLTLYSVLPILRNTVTGIRGVDPAIVEAARGVGMTAREQLRLVELPLALPVIVAGVRTATVWVVGIATLSTPVGAASLGNYIFSGLQTRNLTAVLIGCVAGSLDLYVDYTGTIWATIMKRTDVPADPAIVLTEVSRYLSETHGITMVGALGFENAYALAMRDEAAGRLGITSISDLTAHAPTLVMAGDYEFFSRPEWTRLAATYDLRFRDRRSMDSSLMYTAVASAQVDVISAFSTDGRIAALGLTVLADDRHVIPPYDAVLLASARLAREAPDVLAALRPLAGTIGADTMRNLNAEVDQQGVSPQAVAREFLARPDQLPALSPAP